MNRAFVLCLLVLLTIPARLPASDPDTDGQTTHVGTMRKRVQASTTNVAVRTYVVERQNTYPDSSLTGPEFLDFCHDVLGVMTDEHVDAREFLESTKGLYEAFHPTWLDVKRGITAAAGRQGTRSSLSENQSQFLLMHVPPDAPALTVKGLAVLHQLPALGAEKRNAVWGQVLPSIIEPTAHLDEASHFFVVYDGILDALKSEPTKQILFYEATAGQYRSFSPSAEQIVRSAMVLRNAVGSELEKDQHVAIPAATYDAYPSYRFVHFHLHRAESRANLDTAVALVRAYQAFVAEETPIEIAVRRFKNSSNSYYWQAAYAARTMAYVDKKPSFVAQGKDRAVVDLLTSFRPATVDQTTLAAIENLVSILDSLTADPGFAHEFLLEQLRVAVDLPSFDRLFHLLQSRNQRGRAQRIANERVGAFRDWRPSVERMRAIHGGPEVAAAKVAEMDRPDYFLALFEDALSFHRWEDAHELAVFAQERVGPFFRPIRRLRKSGRSSCCCETNRFPKFAKRSRSARWRESLRASQRMRVQRCTDIWPIGWGRRSKFRDLPFSCA